MYKNKFASYNKVESPQISSDFFNESNNLVNDDKILLNESFENTTDFLNDNDSKDEDETNLHINKHTIERSNQIKNKQKNTIQKELKGPDSFQKVLDEAEKIDPDVKKYRSFLIRTAKRESNFNSKIQNKTGAPYYGYFQMGKNEIKTTCGLTVQQFLNNPVQQVLAAIKLYKLNLKTLKNLNVYNLGKMKGYSDDALVTGAWLAGAGGVKKYLLGLSDPSDSHWYKNGNGGTSVSKVMNDWMNHV